MTPVFGKTRQEGQKFEASEILSQRSSNNKTPPNQEAAIKKQVWGWGWGVGVAGARYH